MLTNLMCTQIYRTRNNELPNWKTEKNIIQFVATNLTQFFSSFFLLLHLTCSTFYADQNYVRKNCNQIKPHGGYTLYLRSILFIPHIRLF